MTKSPAISVVIPTFNRKEALLACLRSLEAQTYDLSRVEVVIVDDGSSDGTRQEVDLFAARSRLRIRCLSHPHAGPSAARNAGVRNTEGAVIAFTEDDVIADSRWLECASRYFALPEAAAVEGRTNLTNSTALRVLERGETPGFLPCNLFIRRDVFLKLGGFDPAYCDLRLNIYFREDADFGFRLLAKGYAVLSGDDVIVSHPEQFRSIWDVFRHARRYLFDPLLCRRYPQFYRKLIEVKHFGPVTIHRPFHYLCWFYVLNLIAILAAVVSGHYRYLVPAIIIMFILHAGLRFRYERRIFPALWNVPSTIGFLILPLYYLYWFVRGCLRFKSWRAAL
jgi:glycosyltransferase involved in cell wall biosynthesis